MFPVKATGVLENPAKARSTPEAAYARSASASHARWIAADPANRYVLVTDLGIEAIMTYGFDPLTGKLDARSRFDAKTPPGAGPRHAVIRPDGRFVYLVNELDSTIIAYQYSAVDGHLRQLQILSTLPDGYLGESAIAAVRATPDGRFVYASNRGHNSIAHLPAAKTGLLEYRGSVPPGQNTARLQYRPHRIISLRRESR